MPMTTAHVPPDDAPAALRSVGGGGAAVAAGASKVSGGGTMATSPGTSAVAAAPDHAAAAVGTGARLMRARTSSTDRARAATADATFEGWRETGVVAGVVASRRPTATSAAPRARWRPWRPLAALIPRRPRLFEAVRPQRRATP